IAVVAFIVLAGTFLFDWVQVEPASLEHKTHISIASIAERSPASRRQIRPSDIVTKIGGIPVPTDSLESVQQLYSSVLNQVLQEGGNGVLIEVYRGQERSEINLPLPQYSNAFELDMPVDGNTEDIGLTLAVVEAQSLHNDEGASLSLMQVWLGGSDDIAT